MEYQRLMAHNDSLKRRLESSLQAMEVATNESIARSATSVLSSKAESLHSRADNKSASAAMGVSRPTPTPPPGPIRSGIEPNSDSSTSFSQPDSLGYSLSSWSKTTNFANSPQVATPIPNRESTAKDEAKVVTSPPTNYSSGVLTSVSTMEFGLGTARALQAQIASRDSLIASLQMRVAEGERARQEVGALRSQASLEQSQYKLKEEALERKIEDLSLSLKTALESEARLKAECALMQRDRLNADANAAHFTVEAASKISLLKSELADRAEQLRAADSREQVLELELERLRNAVATSQQQHENGLRAVKEIEENAIRTRNELEDQLTHARAQIAEFKSTIKTKDSHIHGLEAEKKALMQVKQQLQMKNEELEDNVARLGAKLNTSQMHAERVPELEQELHRLSGVESRAYKLDIELREATASLSQLQDESALLFNEAQTHCQRAEAAESKARVLREYLDKFTDELSKKRENMRTIRVQKLFTLQTVMNFLLEVDTSYASACEGLKYCNRSLRQITASLMRATAPSSERNPSDNIMAQSFSEDDFAISRNPSDLSAFDEDVARFMSKMANLNSQLNECVEKAMSESQVKRITPQTPLGDIDTSSIKLYYDSIINSQKTCEAVSSDILLELEENVASLISLTQQKTRGIARQGHKLAETVPQSSEESLRAVDSVVLSLDNERNMKNNAVTRIDHLKKEILAREERIEKQDKAMAEMKALRERDKERHLELESKINENRLNTENSEVALREGFGHIKASQDMLRKVLASNVQQSDYQEEVEPSEPLMKMSAELVALEAKLLRDVASTLEPSIARERLILAEIKEELESTKEQNVKMEKRLGESIAALQDEAAGTVMFVRGEAAQHLAEVESQVSELREQLETCTEEKDREIDNKLRLQDELNATLEREFKQTQYLEQLHSMHRHLSNTLISNRAGALILGCLIVSLSRRVACLETIKRELSCQKSFILKDNQKLRQYLRHVRNITELLQQQYVSETGISSHDQDHISSSNQDDGLLVLHSDVSPMGNRYFGKKEVCSRNLLRPKVLAIIAAQRFARLLASLRTHAKKKLTKSVESSGPIMNALELWCNLDVTKKIDPENFVHSADIFSNLPAHYVDMMKSGLLTSMLLESFDSFSDLLSNELPSEQDKSGSLALGLLGLVTNAPFVVGTFTNAKENGKDFTNSLNSLSLSALESARWACSSQASTPIQSLLAIEDKHDFSKNLLSKLTAHKLWVLKERRASNKNRYNTLWEDADQDAIFRSSPLIVLSRGYHFTVSRRTRLGLNQRHSTTSEFDVDDFTTSVNALAARAVNQAHALQIFEVEQQRLHSVLEETRKQFEDVSKQLNFANDDLIKVKGEVESARLGLQTAANERKRYENKFNEEQEKTVANFEFRLKESQHLIEELQLELASMREKLSSTQVEMEEAQTDARDERAAAEELRLLLKDLQARSARLEKAVQSESIARENSERDLSEIEVEKIRVQNEYQALKRVIDVKDREIEEWHSKVLALEAALQQSNSEILALHADARNKAAVLRLSRDALGDLESESEAAKNIASKAVLDLENTREAWRQLGKHVRNEAILSPLRATLSESSSHKSAFLTSVKEENVTNVEKDSLGGSSLTIHSSVSSTASSITKDPESASTVEFSGRPQGHPQTLPRVRQALENISLRSSHIVGKKSGSLDNAEGHSFNQKMPKTDQTVDLQLQQAEKTKRELEEGRVSKNFADEGGADMGIGAPGLDIILLPTAQRRENSRILNSVSPNHAVAKSRAQVALNLLSKDRTLLSPIATTRTTGFSPAVTPHKLSTQRSLRFTENNVETGDVDHLHQTDEIDAALRSALNTKSWLESKQSP